MKNFEIEGMIPPVVVPFDANEAVDEEAFRRDVRFLLGNRIDAISSGGSTGEGAILSDFELRRCLEIIMEEKPNELPLVAGIIRNSTREAVRVARDAKAAGADALLVTPVSYYGATQEGNYEYFSRIAAATGLPIIVYNVVVSNLVTPQEFVGLLEIDEVVGIKQVDPVALSETCTLCAANGAAVYSAVDHLLYGTYVCGAKGAISALVTIAPELCVAQWHAFKEGNQTRAAEIHHALAPIVRTYLQRPFPGKVKALLNLQGRSVGAARSPNTSPTKEELREMALALKCAGLI